MRRLLAPLLYIFLLSGCMSPISAGRAMYTEKLRKEWYPKAENGNADYQYLLGDSYCCGPAISYTHDNEKAVNWLCKAAKQEHPDALHDMGKIYRSNKDIIESPGMAVSDLPEDNAVAYAWFYKAVQCGNPEADKYLKEVYQEMDEEEKNRAASLIQQYPNIPCEIAKN